MEVIAGVSSILQIIDSVTRVAKRLNEVRESYNNVALNTALVASRLSTIRAALEALYEWREIDRHPSGPSRQLDEDLGMSLSCCAILISVIDGKLDEFGHMIGLKQKMKYLWLENILKEYISNLEGQVRALQLLLTIFQCRTETEKRQKLGNEESRTIMEQVRAETASLALDNIDFQDAASMLSLNPSVTLDIDSIIMKTPAYKRVYGGARLHLPPTVSSSAVDKSEQADRQLVTPFPKESLPALPLPSRPLWRPVPQSRERVDVWKYYSGEEQEGDHVHETVMADSNDVFELPGETQRSRATSQRNESSEQERCDSLQLVDTSTEKTSEEINVNSVEFSMNTVPDDKSLSTQIEETLPTALTAATAKIEADSDLEGFMNQLNLAFAARSPSRNDEQDPMLLYATAVASRDGGSQAVTVPRDEASHELSCKGSNERWPQSLSHSEDSGLDLSRRRSLGEEIQRPMSTHSSLYACSIIVVPKSQSTATSSPYSCVSCRNLGTDPIPDIDKLDAEAHGLVHPTPRQEQGSANVQRGTNDKVSIKLGRLNQSQPVNAGADTSNASQFHPPMDAFSLSPKSSTDEQHRNDKYLTMNFTAPVDEGAKSDFEDLEQAETSGPVTGLGLQGVKASETGNDHPQEIQESHSSMFPPPRRVAPTRPLSSMNPPAVVFPPSTKPGNAESDQSTLSSDRPSSARDATSTVSSTEATEDSTILSLQQSTVNTTATSISTRVSGLDRDHAHSDLRRLQNELATAKARGDSYAVQDYLQRSIEVVRRIYFAGLPAEGTPYSAKSSSPRLNKVRSNVVSLLGSAKGVALGDSAAAGDTLSVQKILEERVNVDSRSDNVKTPLMRAAMNGHIECMNFLKRYGADEVAVEARGRTVLHMAVATNQLGAVKWLLENYPPPRSDHLKHRASILYRATDLVKGVRTQRNLREASDAEGSKPLHIAAELDQGGMVKILIAAGVDVESKDNWGRTPFHRAIISGRRDSFDTLIRSGAKTTAVDAKSVSLLHLAAEVGQEDMIKTLLANGAERWDFDANGNQPIHSAVLGGNISAVEALATGRTDFDQRTESGETLLHLACLNKDLPVAKYLLTKLVDVNPWAAPSSALSQILSHTKLKGSSMTPLHYACCNHDFEMAVLLLDHGALVNAPTPEGATALMMAVETEDTNLVNLLLQREAKVNAKIPGSLRTALHLAARRGDLETVQQLCRHRADDRARASGSTYGRLPMDECAKCPDKKKGQAVEEYLMTIATNRRRGNARNLQASRSESSREYYSSSAAQIAPLADPVSYAPWARTQHDYLRDQGCVAQQAQTQSPQYYHPDFDVPDEVLPAYEPASAPARLANQAPVYRENYA